MNINFSCWHNGFGFMFLWIGGLYIQVGTIKLIVNKQTEISPIPRTRMHYNELTEAMDFEADAFHEECGDR